MSEGNESTDRGIEEDRRKGSMQFHNIQSLSQTTTHQKEIIPCHNDDMKCTLFSMVRGGVFCRVSLSSFFLLVVALPSRESCFVVVDDRSNSSPAFSPVSMLSRHFYRLLHCFPFPLFNFPFHSLTGRPFLTPLLSNQEDQEGSMTLSHDT